MSLRDLPPLGFLPAFEAAGRLGSFKAAAVELQLTPSAISQQIKAIEDALGVPLFVRHGRSITLTREGELYLRQVGHALTELGSVGRRLRSQTKARVLRLSTTPLFAYEFLLPRLSEFRASFPGFELHIESTMKAVDLATAELDAAIRFGEGAWSGLVAHAIGAIDVAPVCSPTLAERIVQLEDLQAHAVLGVRGQERRADGFLSSCGFARIPPASFLAFETCYEAMYAAEHGLGVTFGMFPVAIEWVTSGRLAVPLTCRHSAAGRVYLVHRCGEDAFPFAEMADWLRGHFEALPRLPEGRIVPTRPFRVLQQQRA